MLPQQISAWLAGSRKHIVLVCDTRWTAECRLLQKKKSLHLYIVFAFAHNMQMQTYNWTPCILFAPASTFTEKRVISSFFWQGNRKHTQFPPVKGEKEKKGLVCSFPSLKFNECAIENIHLLLPLYSQCSANCFQGILDHSHLINCTKFTVQAIKYLWSILVT